LNIISKKGVVVGRRRKCRFVANVPDVTVFKPVGVPMSQLSGVVLGLDGFEAMRLVDGEGLTQEEAAARMQVSRPTLCRMLGEARAQVARALSRGWAIRIEVDVLHAVTGEFESTALEPQCLRAMECAEEKVRGGRICQDRMDRAAVAAVTAVDRAEAARVEDAEAADVASEAADVVSEAEVAVVSEAAVAAVSEVAGAAVSEAADAVPGVSVPRR
jgi:predicted DNA-binding protein (UPF0251 family)